MDCKTFSEKKILYLYYKVEGSLPYGELSSDERDAIGKHLESCSRCRLEFDRLKGTLGLFKGLGEVTPSEECLVNIRSVAREKEATGILGKLREVFAPPKVFLSRPAVIAVAGILAIVLVSLYYLPHFKESVISLEWEDPFFEQRISYLEESLELLPYQYDTENEFYQPITFEDELDRVEEELDLLVEEIQNV